MSSENADLDTLVGMRLAMVHETLALATAPANESADDRLVRLAKLSAHEAHENAPASAEPIYTPRPRPERKRVPGFFFFWTS